ncbi:MAG TPA: helix-turn-helix transcriptional regulator [Planctomycetota bacterium]|nr:helix-turn-helix transcriptional regulator [Planctomycetota bacterium]
MYDGNRLRAERLRRGWTLQEASQRLGLSVNHVSQHERRKYKIPKPTTVRAYAGAYGLTDQDIRQILTGTPECSPTT